MNSLFFCLKLSDMPVYTKEEIKAQLVALDAKIGKSEDRQSYASGGPGAGAHEQRGDLAAMYRERERLTKEYERLEGLVSGGGKNLARFPRPR